MDTEYLEYESRRRGVPVEQIRQEEAAAIGRIQRSAPTREQLRRLAEITYPDPRLLEGDEECPFDS